jgi:hypothetical protein
LLPQLTAGRRVSWRRRELEPGDPDAVLRVWSCSSSYVLTDECRCPRRELRAAVVSGHARRRGLMLGLAGATRRLRRMTPDAAQQRNILAHCQCQHDGNDSCSKHGVLTTDEGKSCASKSKGRSKEILGFGAGKLLRDEAPCGISPVGAENPARQSLGSEAYASVLFTFLLALLLLMK